MDWLRKNRETYWLRLAYIYGNLALLPEADRLEGTQGLDLICLQSGRRSASGGAELAGDAANAEHG